MSLGNQTHLLDPDTGLVSISTPGTSMSWSPDGTRRSWYEGDSVVIASNDGSVARQAFPPLQNSRKGSVRISWNASSDAMLVHLESQVWLWTLGSAARDLGPMCEAAGIVVFSPVGALACMISRTSLRVFEPQTGKVFVSKEVPDGVHAIAWSADGRRIATLTNRPIVTLRDAATLEVIRELHGLEMVPSDVAWQPDDQRIAAAAHGGVCLWDPDTGVLTARLTERDRMDGVQFSPNGHELAVMCFGGEVLIYDTRLGRQ